MSTPAWKQFEKLVGLIEQVLAPEGAIVTLNDQIADVETGEPRQIDASIRMKVCSATILVIVECRKRDRHEDARWIEELDGRAKSMGAHKVIAVSSDGFTEPAILKAKMRNIDVRTLSEIDAEVIKSWFHPGVINQEVMIAELVSLDMIIHGDPNFRKLEFEDKSPEYAERLFRTPLFKFRNRDRLVSISDICWEIRRQGGPWVWDCVPNGEGPYTKPFQARFPPAFLTIDSPNEGTELEIAELRYVLTLRRELSEVKPSSVLDYATPNEGSIAHSATWPLIVGGRSLGQLRLVRDHSGKTTGRMENLENADVVWKLVEEPESGSSNPRA